MNEEIRSILKKILEMQLDCTQMLTTILFKNDEPQKDEELHTSKILLEEHKNQIEIIDKKQKKKHLNHDKSVEVTNQINSDHQNVILDPNSKLKLSPQQCYQKLNYIIQEFRQRNQLIIKPQSCDFEYIKNYHSKAKFKELRNMVKLVINSMENKKMVISKANGQKVIQCPSCDFQGFTGVYYPHILKKHCQNYYIFSCFLCYRDFQSFILLKKHLKRQHKQILNNSSDIEIIKVQYDDNENDLSINI